MTTHSGVPLPQPTPVGTPVASESDGYHCLSDSEAPSRAHWWIISSPNGPTCDAVCKKCKARRVFSTTGEEFFGGDSKAQQAARNQSAGKATVRRLSTQAQTSEFYAEIGKHTRGPWR